MENTNLFKIQDLESANAKLILKEVSNDLSEKGYDAINQIVGYLITGDENYISNYNGAREKITSIPRVDLMAYILKEYLK